MKKITKLCIIMIGVLFLSIFTASKIYQMKNESKITDFVTKNHEELEIFVCDYMKGDHSVDHYKGVKIDGVYKQMIQLTYTSFGIAPASKYYGLYYSVDDLPAAYQNADVSLVSVSDDEWEWSDGTGNGGITKRVLEHWFYYEAWF